MFTITVSQNSTTKTFTRGRSRDAALLGRQKLALFPDAEVTVTDETGEIIWKFTPEAVEPVAEVTVTQEQVAALTAQVPAATAPEEEAPAVKTATKFKITNTNLMVIKSFQLSGLTWDDAFLDVSANSNQIDPRLMQIEITSSNNPLPVAAPGAVLRSNGGYWRPVVFENSDGTGAIRAIGARQNNRTLAVLAVIDLWTAAFPQ